MTDVEKQYNILYDIYDDLTEEELWALLWEGSLLKYCEARRPEIWKKYQRLSVLK
jgi:hypothetical protein